MQNFERIRSLITASQLESTDKMALTTVFADIPDTHLKDLAELIEKDISWIEKLNDNRKKKVEAISTGNKELWNQILEEEKVYLQALPYDSD